MTTMNTAQLKQAIETSKRCDALAKHLATLRASPQVSFFVDIKVGYDTIVMAMPRETIESELMERLHSVKCELEALGITHLETTA